VSWLVEIVARLRYWGLGRDQVGELRRGLEGNLDAGVEGHDIAIAILVFPVGMLDGSKRGRGDITLWL